MRTTSPLFLAFALAAAAPVGAGVAPLDDDEGMLAFIVDSTHGLTSIQMVREDASGSFRVANKVAPGKTPVFVRLDAGRYCLWGFSIEGWAWTMNQRDGLCWTVKPGVVSYAATLQPRQFRTALNGKFNTNDQNSSNNQVLNLHDPKGFLAVMQAEAAPEWTALPHDDASLVEDVAHNAKIFQRVGEALNWSRIYDISARMFEVSFKLGRPFAATLRGDLDRLGFGRKKDEAAAVEWYRKAAESGDPRGAALYCQALDLGLAGSRDVSGAVGWCRRAVDGGDALGQYWYSRLMHRGEGGLKSDPVEEARLVAAAIAPRPFDPARETHPRDEDDDPKDHEETLPELFRRSFGFKAGDGSYPDGEEALRVALLESEEGDARGANLAAYLVAKGVGTAPDWQRAEQLYLRGMRIGDDPQARAAMVALATGFWEGKDGFPRDLAKAASYFERLGVEGRDWGRAELAWFLATVDDDSRRNPKRALELIDRALRHNDQQSWPWVDTRAAALAALGDFEAARKEQERALAMALRVGAADEEIQRAEERLAKYQKGVAERR